ncbi:hypothetical protein BKA61DRAFT_597362 [Leptodontidium sp. MPI-SDFR-AT-0119]|nr:hypothetical protein BKA61DRAFT_597362 [Leptodontidium sp. MPI-SDFR-AT-0119]
MTLGVFLVVVSFIPFIPIVLFSHRLAPPSPATGVSFSAPLYSTTSFFKGGKIAGPSCSFSFSLTAFLTTFTTFGAATGTDSAFCTSAYAFAVAFDFAARGRRARVAALVTFAALAVGFLGGIAAVTCLAMEMRYRRRRF